jgi:hypothetical protein
MSSNQIKSEESIEKVEREQRIQYFPNPQRVIEMYPDKVHLIEQSYLRCELCKVRIPINDNNMEALVERYNRNKQTHNGYCLTANCMKNQRRSVDQLKEHAKFKRIDDEVYQMELFFEEREKIRELEKRKEKERHECWVDARNETQKLCNAFKLMKEKSKDETK